MATPYSSIFDLFLVSIQDYKIDNLYISSPTSFETYLKGFLIKGLINFTNCKQDLEDRNDTSNTFNITLTTTEQVILSNLMVIEWLTKEVNDIKQMQLHLQDGDFKTYAEANNLKEKNALLTSTRENVDRQMNKYSYSNIDWTTL